MATRGVFTARELGFERATGSGADGARAFGGDVALLVIDVQNDFVPPRGALAVDGGDEIVGNCSEAIDAFERVVFSQDYHPEVRARAKIVRSRSFLELVGDLRLFKERGGATATPRSSDATDEPRDFVPLLCRDTAVLRVSTRGNHRSKRWTWRTGRKRSGRITACKARTGANFTPIYPSRRASWWCARDTTSRWTRTARSLRMIEGAIPGSTSTSRRRR